MLPELGNFALILGLCFALLQSVAPLCGYYRKNFLFFELSIIASIGQFIFLSIAMLCLIICFINNDFTVLFVREHSHHLLPLIYRIGAAWGGHEGSLLLWCLILSSWTMLFLIFSGLKHIPHLKNTFFKIVMILGFISFGFILFLFTTSNPFLRNFPNQLVNGNDLTPLLQDPGLIFHPPMLYLGYVGFAIGFAFAIAALIEGKFAKECAKACRPWIILPWAFLGFGIVLGSWWAYRELGWGGWWFWDPVENASLLPWLVATALIHSLIVSEKRDVFKGWTLLLAIVTFALSLIGTFLVRSGVLVSVHAFASDPTRGIFLLGYLALLMGGAFLLYTLRINYFYQAPRFKLFSRETLLLINSVILLTVMSTILIGTLYPIILDALNSEKISVGEPYYNIVFIPIMLPLLLLMGFAPHVNWGEQHIKTSWKKLRITILISVLLGFLGPLLFGFTFSWIATIGSMLGVWIICATIQYVFTLQHVTLQHAAMILAHIGIGIVVLGITLNKTYSEERQLKLFPGETTTLAGYQFTFENIGKKMGSNYESLTATFSVKHPHHKATFLAAEQRIYTSHEQTLSKPGITYNAFRDLYLAVGTIFSDGSWSVRIYYKPCVRWIWFGGFLLLLGGLLGLLRYLPEHRKKIFSYENT